MSVLSREVMTSVDGGHGASSFSGLVSVSVRNGLSPNTYRGSPVASTEREAWWCARVRAAGSPTLWKHIGSSRRPIQVKR